MKPVAPVNGLSAPATQVRHVAPRATPVTPVQVRAAVATAYAKQTGGPASPAMLDVLTAQISHETGRGDHLNNYNLGGIKGKSPHGAVASYATHEVDAAGESHRTVDGFRAYGSLAEGADDYVKVMRTTFASALPAAARGDADGFAAALKQRGYFTAHLTDYAASLRALTHDPSATGRTGSAVAVAAMDTSPFSASLGPLPDDPSGAAALPTSDVVLRVLDAVAAMSTSIGAPIDAERPQSS
jgi:flagellar protein FlgJ